MVQWCRRMAAHPTFQGVALLVIVLAALIIGLQTSAALAARYAGLFKVLDRAIQLVFVLELAIRLVAFWPRLPRFFRDGWNTFDFVIVAASFLPASGAYATVGRLARLARAGRLFSRVPELRLLIETMLRSIPSMAHVVMLLLVLLYIYAVLGVHLLGAGDPDRWATLPRAGLTLVGVLTLEGWVEVQEAALAVTPWAWVYFLSFIVLAVFVGVNLFIAIIIHNLEQIKQEEAAEHERELRESGAIAAPPPAAVLVAELREKLALLEVEVAKAG
jgi:voltage-gated sodium channel